MFRVRMQVSIFAKPQTQVDLWSTLLHFGLEFNQMRMRCGAKEGSTNGLPREQYKRLNKTRCFNLKAGDILGK